MYPVAGIADQHDTLVGHSGAVMKTEWIAAARCGHADSAQRAAAGLIQLGRETAIRQLHVTRCLVTRNGPDNGRAMTAIVRIQHRQQSKRPRAVKNFIGHIIVRLLMIDRADHGAVIILPARRGDPQLFARFAAAPLRRDQKRCGQNRPIGQHNLRDAAIEPTRNDILPQMQRNPIAGFCSIEEGPAQQMILIHGAQRIAGPFRLEIEAAGPQMVEHLDRLDGAALARQMRAKADRLQHRHARTGYGRGAAVEATCRHRFRIEALDDMGGHALRRQSQRLCQADQPATQYDCCFRHARLPPETWPIM